ncbi:hypothetical protein LEN26_006826 [Aphanomyces euteiches]|nr:hypothetical protein LEN26_006826 [Aphanomyces euteiches]KAH9184543.1 hypothetical protein AeNC1_013480 [Aphanomyces euteiches]
MVEESLNCLVVCEGTPFPVKILADKTVGILKDKIKEKIGGPWRAMDLELYHTTKGNTVFEGDFLPKLKVQGSGSMDVEYRYFDENPPEEQIHVLVVVPSHDESNETKYIQKFNAPIEFSSLDHEGGVPSTFRTLRKATVDAFARLLDEIPVIFIRAPPMSGKSGLCTLLHNHILHYKPDTVVVVVHAKTIPPNATFCDYFKSTYHCEFDEFSKRPCKKVVLIDEAEMTYDDQLLWSGYLKNTLDGTLLGLQFVLFSSYGSFDTYRVQARAGTLIVIPLKNTFGLNGTDLKPGLQLSREELEEMVAGTIGAPVSDLIWVLCSGHIGIARAMLRYFASNLVPSQQRLMILNWNFAPSHS